MANSMKGKVWYLDTATTIWTGPVYLGKLEYHPSAAGQHLEVTDGLGHTIWKVDSIAAGNDASVGIEDWSNPEHKTPFDGFIVKTITSGGVLYVTVV